MQLVSDFGGHADGPVAFCLSNLAGFQEKSYFPTQRTAVQARYTFTLVEGCMFGMKLKRSVWGLAVPVVTNWRTASAASDGCRTPTRRAPQGKGAPRMCKDLRKCLG